MIRNNFRYTIIILMIITLTNCKKSVDNLDGWEIPDCINLKMAIIDLNSDMVKIEINKMLTDLEPNRTKDDEWGHEKNLDILVNRLNSNCDSINASLFCYCCNKSLPPQSIIILSVDSSRTIITRSLDIWTPDDDILQCTEIHKYYN
ncbi:MAG: hypothetical protein P8Y99_17490 [Calditrichaceae bacterium]